ncbi:hypothetical protein Taro_051373, partial [Colocasia esculenta]|nr:hypothetical protein [Colocasia esculenta]
FASLNESVGQLNAKVEEQSLRFESRLEEIERQLNDNIDRQEQSARFAAFRSDNTMAPRRRPREGVAKQVIRQEAGDAPPPQQTQPLPQDVHSGIVPPLPPPPQVGRRRLSFQASLATPVLVRPSCSE